MLRNPIRFRIERSQPKIEPFYSRCFLQQVLGIAPRKPTEPITEAHCNLAKSLQARFEEVANHLVQTLHDQVGGKRLALAGGCAHNSVWVGKIPQNSPYQEVFVAPAAHDAGIAVGAAIGAAQTEVFVQGGHWGLLGPDENESISNTENIHSKPEEKIFKNEGQLIHWMVEQLSSSKIIGLFQGRMEFGPRALGSRSILADPRQADMRDRLNERVKHRETFRPFAASVLAEHQNSWFKNSFDSPNMEAVFQVEQEFRDQILGVVHTDNTCRIQTIRKETQPFYWNLIEAFRKKTGVPLLINTSFNDTEPIVCSPDDALKCFAQTDLDFLVIGLRVFLKRGRQVA